MSAIYRVAFEGWTKDEALDELLNGGFGWHSVWNETLLPFFAGADIALLKEKAGVK